MKLERSGIILYTERYNECVRFYADVFALPILFENEELTCFLFGGSYLMVEREGVARPSGKPASENPTCLRFNVSDMTASVNHLRNHSIQVDFQEYSWGSIAKFYDPDGNLCELRDEKSFSAQIKYEE